MTHTSHRLPVAGLPASRMALWFGLVCLFLGAGGSIATAQEDSIVRRTTHATLFGFGASWQQDTYLSPLRYDGMQFSVFHETQRLTRLLKGRVAGHSRFQLNITDTENEPRNADYMGGQLHYDYALLYPWTLGQHWQLMAGPQLGGTLGILYNTRNGNNPAQALANIHLNIAAGAVWRFHLWRRDFAVRDQLDFALLGAMFSPAYGQSYYELFSLGHTDHNVRLTQPFNARRFRNQLTLDVPCRRTTLRLGCFLDVQGSHVNDIRHSDCSVGFVVGWVRRLVIERPTRPSR